MSGVELDWSSAEVHDGTLEVALRGDPPEGWAESFKRTLALLPSGEWEKVRLKKNQVRVDGVAQGGADRLHHFLESVVQQANAGHEPSEPDAPEEDQEPEQNEPDRLDAEMTERFRSFAAE